MTEFRRWTPRNELVLYWTCSNLSSRNVKFGIFIQGFRSVQWSKILKAIEGNSSLLIRIKSINNYTVLLMNMYPCNFIAIGNFFVNLVNYLDKVEILIMLLLTGTSTYRSNNLHTC